MSENKKSETTEKVMTSYDKKVQRRKEEEKKEQARKKQSKIISAVVIVALIAFIAYFPISKAVAVHSTYMKVGDYKVTETEFAYYYNMGVNSFVSQYGSFLPYMGLNVNKDFAEQQYSENATWDDYFQESAAQNLTQTKALVSEAKANGFEHDSTAETDKYMEVLETAAKDANMNLSSYVKSTFGKYATAKNIRPIIEESFYASAYYDLIAEGKTYSEEEIAAYYEENKNTYDSVDVKVVEVEAEMPNKEVVEDADGNTTVPEPTEEEIAEAMKAAKEIADEKLKTVGAEGELKENLRMAGASSLYKDWLFDAERKTGDTTVVEDETNHKYFVLQFEKRYLNETNTVNLRVISTAEDQGEQIVSEWNGTGANEDAFIALVEKYSEDAVTNTKGGLFENLSTGSLNTEMGAWAADADRKSGDVTTINTETGLHYVVYYIGQGAPEWKASIQGTLKAQEMQEYMNGITEPFEITDVKGKLTYLTIPKETQDDEQETESSTEEETEE